MLRSAAPYLSSEFVEENFDFYGRTLTGAPELRDRWKRGVAFVEGAAGELVGKLYVAEHFPPMRIAPSMTSSGTFEDANSGIDGTLSLFVAGVEASTLQFAAVSALSINAVFWRGAASTNYVDFSAEL